jgi:quercetin dioxygenase-like cupin family protein
VRERIRDTTGTSRPRTEAAILPALRVTFAQFDEHGALTRAVIRAAASAAHSVHGSGEGRAARPAHPDRGAHRTTLTPPADTGRVVTLGPNEGRTPTPLNVVVDETPVKVAAVDSGGALAAFHLVASAMSGPPRHVHPREDEWFDVLQGKLAFAPDGERRPVGAGGSAWRRRGVVHAYHARSCCARRIGTLSWRALRNPTSARVAGRARRRCRPAPRPARTWSRRTVRSRLQTGAVGANTGHRACDAHPHLSGPPSASRRADAVRGALRQAVVCARWGWRSPGRCRSWCSPSSQLRVGGPRPRRVPFAQPDRCDRPPGQPSAGPSSSRSPRRPPACRCGPRQLLHRSARISAY